MRKYLAGMVMLAAFFSVYWAVPSYAAGGRLLVSIGTGTAVAVVDTDLWEIEGNIEVGADSAEMKASPDGKIVYVTVCSTSEVKAIDVEKYKVVASVKLRGCPYQMDITADGRYLLVQNYSDQSITVIETGGMTVVRTVKTEGYPKSVCLSPDGRHAYVSIGDGAIQVFLVPGLELVKEFKAPPHISAFAISKDGGRLYCNSIGAQEVVVYDTATYKVVASYRGYEVDGVALSPDGKELWHGGPEMHMTVDSLVDDKVLATLPTGTYTGVFDIAFSPDGRYVAATPSGLDSKMVYIYDTEKKELIKKVEMPGYPNFALFLK